MSAPSDTLDQRERKCNVDKLSAEQADQLGAQIGEKLRKMVDKTVEDANRFLKVYGLQAKMQIALEQIPTEPKGE